jgi:uncharacterized membrane protein
VNCGNGYCCPSTATTCCPNAKCASGSCSTSGSSGSGSGGSGSGGGGGSSSSYGPSWGCGATGPGAALWLALVVLARRRARRALGAVTVATLVGCAPTPVASAPAATQALAASAEQVNAAEAQLPPGFVRAAKKAEPPSQPAALKVRPGAAVANGPVAEPVPSAALTCEQLAPLEVKP